MSAPYKPQWSGGVNLLVDPTTLPDNQAAQTLNIWPSVEGIIGKRHSVAFEQTAVSNPSTSYRPLACFVPASSTGFDLIVHYADDASNEYVRALTFASSNEANNPGIQVATGAPNDYHPMSFVNYRGGVIGVGAGLEGAIILWPNYPGTTHGYPNEQTIARGAVWLRATFDARQTDLLGGVIPQQTQSQPVVPRVLGVYRDRLIFANFGLGMGDWLAFGDRSNLWANKSAYDTAPDSSTQAAILAAQPEFLQVGTDILAGNGAHLEMQGLQGETILSVEEISTNSVTNALQTAMLVRSKNFAVVVTGEVAESNLASGPSQYNDSYLGDFTPATVNRNAGIAGAYAHCRSPNGIFWANGDDVYALYDGAPQPVQIGTNIRPALRLAPPALMPFWHMAYSEGCVYLSVPTADSTGPLGMIVQHWRLDVRPTGDGDEMAQPQGPTTARWWGPMDYSGLAQSALDPTNPSLAVTPSTGACIFGSKGKDNQDVLYGLVYTECLMNGAGGGQNSFFLNLVSFNKVFQARDVPYREVQSARIWAANDTVANGDIVRPTDTRNNGTMYLAVVGGSGQGVTSSTEPDWGTVASPVQNVTTDGTVTHWYDVRALRSFAVLGVQQNAVRTPNSNGQTGVLDIVTKWDLKEYDFGSHTRDKLLKRLDLAVLMQWRQLLWAEVLVNSGDQLQFMGPLVAGGPEYRLFGALNQLGAMKLGSGAMASEYQARTMRPNSTGSRAVAYGATGGIVTPGVVRGRSLQPRLREGTGFLVDSTNDYVCAASYQDSVGLTTPVKQLQLTHGYYATMNDVMNMWATVMGGFVFTGFTNFPGPGLAWSRVTTYGSLTASVFPGLAFQYTGRTAASIVLASAYDPSDSIKDDQGSLATNTNFGLPLYLGRCQRFLAMMGLDSGGAYSTQAAWPVTVGGVSVFLVGEQLAAANHPAVGTSGAGNSAILGNQAQPYTNAVEFSITEMELEVVSKAGRPYGTQGRLS